MIAIIDYNMGNLHSVIKGCQQVGADVRIVTTATEIESSDKVILPGVGAFADAINTLRYRKLVEPIQKVINKGRPFLGICLGLQLLFDVSYEDGEYEGLGIIPGEVIRFDFAGRKDQHDLKIPHMGWNALNIHGDIPIYRQIDTGSFVYFVHSYYVIPLDDVVIATTTQHGIEFVSSIRRDNLFATQFHPEKSQRVGLQILKNFADL
jgi:imidazole glycerol-phosphate synthase subunit HisH